MSNKRKKRANGEGCIRKLSDGRWEDRITDGYTANGKQHFKTFSAKKQSEVIEKLNKYKENISKFDYDIATKYTVKQWLNIWYNNYVISNVKHSTRVRYEGIIRNHLIPNIGHIKLVDLKKVHIEKMYEDLLTINKKDKSKKGLSVKSIRNIHLVLHKALQEALEREYISKNPASISKVPTMKSSNVKREEIQIYSKEEQDKLINIAKQDKIYGIVVIFALYTGMRKAEILGLQWSDINFENRTIRVNKQLRRFKNYDDTHNKNKTFLGFEYDTKTENSTRIIPMLKILKEFLQEHLKNQEENKKIFGKSYKNNNMVFCREDGSFLDPDTVLAKYKRLAEKAGIKQCTFHALRHTFATRGFESEISVKMVSQILGHYSVEFTLDIYTHVLEEIKTFEMEKLEKYLATKKQKEH